MRQLVIALITTLVLCSCGEDKPVTTQKYLNAYDGNNTNIGYVAFTDWPKIGLILTDSSILSVAAATGKYNGSLCDSGYCTSSTLEALLCDTSTCGTHLSNPLSNTYCYYTSSDCSGTCYLPDKPFKNSVFVSKSGYYKATGSETGVSVMLRSAYRNDYGDCGVISPTLSGNGHTATMYSPANSYTLPTGIVLPLPTPVSIAP